MEILITEIRELNKRNTRIKLYSNAWYTLHANCRIESGLVLKPGLRARITIDGFYIKAIDKVNDGRGVQSSLIDYLYKEIDRLNRVNAFQRRELIDSIGLPELDYRLAEQAGLGLLNTDSYENEITQIESYKAENAVKVDKQDTLDWIGYTTNPGLVQILWNRIQNGHTDRLKDGRDIRARIADFCDNVPVGMLPEEIADHLSTPYYTAKYGY